MQPLSPAQNRGPTPEHFNFHPYLSGKLLSETQSCQSRMNKLIFPTGDKCDSEGNWIPPNSFPDPRPPLKNPWSPFDDEVAFRLAGLLFKKTEMSQPNIDELLDLWAHDVQKRFGGTGGPFGTHQDLLGTIDAIKHGSAPWQYTTPTATEWQKTSYQVWYCDPDTVISNILANPDFADQFDPAPYVHIDAQGQRHWSNFFSGNYAFRHATTIYEDPEAGGEKVRGAMYCPIILGSDKTTVSVATGHVEYHLLYLSVGNLHNVAHCGHRNGVIPIGFLAIPKSDRKYDADPKFRIFKKRLYHSSIAAILRSLKPAMTTPVVRLCPDGHFRWVIYDLGAFIADYPEQVLLAGVVQGWCCRYVSTHPNLISPLMDTLFDVYGSESGLLWDNFSIDDGVVPFTHEFPRADIHEMLTPDLLHQIIKGSFKDMLVEWVVEYLELTYGKERANEIMDRISLAPSFPGLHRFPHGRRFKQWTGDDSKALMKVFLSAVVDYIPESMALCLSSFQDFCVLVRRNDFTTNTIAEVQQAIHSFHQHRQIFLATDTRMKLDISQMLLTNQRLDKLTALHSDLADKGLMPPLHSAPPVDPFEAEREDEGVQDGEHLLAKVELAKKRVSNVPRYLEDLAEHLDEPDLPDLTRRFLYEQLLGTPADGIDIDQCPGITSKVNIYHSAVATFFAPSDNSGLQGMHWERIRSTPSWYGHPRRDTVAVVMDESLPGFRGMSAARIRLFFSFIYDDIVYPCALVHWFNTFSRTRDSRTGLWVVRPSYLDGHQLCPHLAVIHLDSILRGIHLMPVYGSNAIPPGLKYYNTLDIFKSYYVNRLADYHANEILF
ncbi:hypothetical protein BDP27DRAFT_1385119 [Rhodocollybia butyracea]|uniref:Uncharacterized protein n=1 Tax=Rhodocollybia butyracea TaxID=206335 RepID=A0A9P5PCF6_9AGAR|nr:hypothetical protein BDP27DRAFT_1385119 [Rhodocollybia butyracea]